MHFFSTAAFTFALGMAFADPGVSPPSVIKEVEPGKSFTIDKKVTTPIIPPKPDVVLLIDVTYSMKSSIANIKTNMINVISEVSKVQRDAQFAVVSYGDFADPNRFTVNQGLTNNAIALQNAVNSLTAELGGDEDEDWINALYQLSTGALTYRPDSSRIIVLIGDAASHEPSNGHSLDGDTLAALSKQKIRVIGVNVGLGQLDKHKQASKVTSATGGSIVDSAPETVTKAIVTGLKNLDVTVKSVISCDGGLSATLDPSDAKVSSGEVVTFKETVKVAVDAPQNTTRQCFVSFTLNNTPGGASFVQVVSIRIPQMSCFTCNPHPGSNKCHITTSCTPTPFGNMCLTRPGYKADSTEDDNTKVQWRMKWPVPGHEHRVAVLPGKSADTLCDKKNSGPDVCKEVSVYDCTRVVSLSNDINFSDQQVGDDDAQSRDRSQQVGDRNQQVIGGQLEL